jgi:hypothetical protein
MADPTAYFVDPSIAAASGAGTIGDPYGDLQHALDTITRDSTNGDKINIKAGTDEVLSSAMSLATYGTPTVAAPLWLVGYTSAEDDQGVGGIDCNGNAFYAAASTQDGFQFIDLEIHNCAGNRCINLDNDVSLIRVEIHNLTGASSPAVDIDNRGILLGCYLHNINDVGYAINGADNVSMMNYFENGTQKFDTCIQFATSNPIAFSIMDLDSNSDGIDSQAAAVHIFNNSIYANAGTGEGINCGYNNNYGFVHNNVIEGFSGTGGDGFALGSTSKLQLVMGNAAYNNTTHYTYGTGRVPFKGWNSTTDTNETLSASGFTSASTGDFSPVDTGSMDGGSFPDDFHQGSANNVWSMWKGAVQPAPAGGGGSSSIIGPNIRGGYLNFLPNPGMAESPWKPYIPVWLDTAEVLRTLKHAKERLLLRHRPEMLGPRITDPDFWHPITWQSRVHLGAWTRERSKRLALQKQFLAWDRHPYGDRNGKEVWV